MVKKSTQVKRKSSSKKQVPKKSTSKKSSSTKKIAKGVGMAALTAGLGYAAYKGVEKYKEKKQETPKASVYDNIVSFFGFNKKAETVDTCQNELNKLKEELSNAKKNDSGVDQCKNELNKISSELQKSKEELENFKKIVDKVMSDEVDKYEIMQARYRDKYYDFEEAEKKMKDIVRINNQRIVKLSETNNKLKKENDDLKLQISFFQKRN